MTENIQKNQLYPSDYEMEGYKETKDIKLEIMYVKNKKTNEIKKVNCNQGNNWKRATKEEINEYEFKRKKLKLINLRKNSLKTLGIEYFDLIENMPEEIKNKRNIIRKELQEIEKIDNKEDLLNYNNFEV